MFSGFIAVYDSLAMRVVERVGHFAHDPRGVIDFDALPQDHARYSMVPPMLSSNACA